MDDRARTLAGAILQHAEPGDRALMTYPPGLEFIEAFLGCLYARVVAVPAYPPKKNRNAERVLAIAQDCQPRLILCTAETRSNVQGEFAAAIQGAEVLLTDKIGTGGATGLRKITSDGIAFLQYTSGSTSEPKGVMVSHGNIVANERLIQQYFDFDQSSVMISWLPMFHDMGLIGALFAPLFVGFPAVPNGQRIVSCGQVGPDLEVRIVDPETGVQSHPDEIGEIWVRGASVAQGYLHRPEETEATFRAKIGGDDRHWLRTGDYGFLRGGELYVAGRLKDLIIIRGRNIYPQDIERAVERALPFVEANTCAAFSVTEQGVEHLGLMIEANRELVRIAKARATDPAAAATLHEHVARVREEVGEEFEIPVHALAFVRPGEFPRTSSGKVQRHRYRELLQSGDYQFVFVADRKIVVPTFVLARHRRDHMSDHQQIAIRVAELLGDTLRVDIDSNWLDANLVNEYGANSMDVVDIVETMERKFGVTITNDQIPLIKTFGDLVKLAQHDAPRSAT